MFGLLQRPTKTHGESKFAWLRLLVLPTLLSFAALHGLATPSLAQQQKLILVIGAPGQEEYGEQFRQWADQWEAVVEEANSNARDLQADEADQVPTDEVQPAAEKTVESAPCLGFTKIGLDETTEISDFERLKKALTESIDPDTQSLWIVLIGHGTYDRKAAKFNLRGPDVSAKQLSQWLDGLSCQVVLINCASASGPFINEVAGRNRIIVTATKSGYQYNFARFGQYLAESIGDPAIDLDKDQQTSLLEAFLAASARAQEFYAAETRLATELALIDDNGDGLGTPADWFQGTRAIQKPKQGEADGLTANQVVLVRRGADAKLTPDQIAKRNELEQKLERLRERKPQLGEDAYYELIEPLMLELAKIYHAQNQ